MSKKPTEKHKEAMRQGMQRYRARQKALKAEAAGTVVPDVVIPNEPGCETPAGLVQAVPVRYGMADCKCQHCKKNKGKYKINHWAFKSAFELEKNEINRVVFPEDVDYEA